MTKTGRPYYGPKRGLPYGWWKSSDFWAFTVSLLALIGLSALFALCVAAWFLDWKPVL